MVGAVDKRSPPNSVFDSRTRRFKWVEFVVGSRLAPRVFFPGSPVFFLPQEPTPINSNAIWTPGPPLITILPIEGVTLLKYWLLIIIVFKAAAE